jgi:hypothetical protein
MNQLEYAGTHGWQGRSFAPAFADHLFAPFFTA